ncbi:alpha/beta fold hydrolase [Corynebacterium glyciniphilum]|uniref:alpha/beta fold hydrolase n=1 Tax=Corynebacterium glyciniphilum TaxID=1404244 RepID=UPI0011AB3D11|nr:alpha/beta hydrolase [Corynebacterium glyciniphilum]
MNQTRRRGTGDHAVVCLNGWFGHAGTWGPWENYLDGDEFTWVFPDYRGYGRRQGTSGEFTVVEVSSDICGVLEDLPHSRISLLGHSMGGVFMQRVLADSSRGIESMVGISPVGAAGTPMPPEQRALFESAEFDIGARQTIIDITTGNNLSPQFTGRLAEETRDTSADAAVGGYFRAWADADFLEQLGRRDLPVKAFVGAVDPAVTVETVRSSFGKTYPHLDLEVLPNVGHYSMYEMPLYLGARIEEFLRRSAA